MIKIKVSDMLGKYKMTQKELAQKTGIRPGTISALYHETAKRIEIWQLDALCQAFNCKIEDILEYIPDDKQKTT